MVQHFKAPAEGPDKPLDYLNPVEIAAFTVKKSIDGLKMLLGIKKDRMASLKPQGSRDREILAATNDSVSKRLQLAEGITLG